MHTPVKSHLLSKVYKVTQKYKFLYFWLKDTHSDHPIKFQVALLQAVRVSTLLANSPSTETNEQGGNRIVWSWALRLLAESVEERQQVGLDLSSGG